MELYPLVNFLENRLKQSMPGESAHNLMKPKLPNGRPIQLKHSEPPREGGVMILLYEEAGNVRFPLIQRPEYNGVHSGQIAFPGGKKEPNDQTLIDTALRESQEEIGVDSNQVKIVGSLSKFFIAASNFDVLPVIGYTNEKPEFNPDIREVSGIITPDVRDLLNDQKKGTKDILVSSGIKLNSPYFDLEQKVVWGATAMMLSEFVAILSEFDFLKIK